MGKASKQSSSSSSSTSTSTSTSTTTMTTSNNNNNKKKTTTVVSSSSTQQKTKELAAEHLPPIGLVFIVILCSGFMFMFAFRDVFATGKVIGGTYDEAMLKFTKSTVFFNNMKGWKSQQGGLSTIQQVTTDANNMGGLFIRKVGGAASLGVQLMKLLPLLIHPSFDTRWKRGHFIPLLTTAIISNICLISFYASYLQDLATVNAHGIVQIFMIVLVIESLSIIGYLYKLKKQQKRDYIATVIPNGKTPNSIVSRIVARTVLIVSTAMTVIVGRDLFFPGQILPLLPRDDIYLEWTNAFIHSPPDGSPEEEQHGIDAALHIDDKYVSQLMALNLLILCLYKFVSSLYIKIGNDGKSGEISSKMIWKSLAISNGLLVFLIRLFASAAKSASLDLRWHLMALAYETFIFGLYGFL